MTARVALRASEKRLFANVAEGYSRSPLSRVPAAITLKLRAFEQ